jgi:pyruvate/2-oxoglutarate dehydrogenase complex dihydrolipoamide dehydrogenase (E3) component
MNQPESYEVIVLGGGKGGKTLATALGHRGIKTALLERSAEMFGGGCINVACIPTKTLIASARAAQAARLASDFGVHTGEVTVNWPEVRQRAQGVVAAMRAMNHKNFTSAPALDFILGTGRFLSPGVIEVRENDGTIRQLTAEKIFINTGTRPAWPVIPGLDEAGALNSETIQRLDQLPRHLVILGGGYIALEFAQMFRRFGSEVTILERASQLLGKEDPDVAEALGDVLREEGIDIQLNCAIERIERDSQGVSVVLARDGKSLRVSGSHILAALGRTPNTEDLNLAAVGIATDQRGYVAVNERLETTATGVWALGDVNGGPQFTHASLDDYRIVKANVFDGGQRTTTDRLVPFALFTEPELARIGLTEKEARQQGLEILVAKMAVGTIPRARTTGEKRGFFKVIVDAKTQRILGCAIFSVEAGEILGAVQMTMIAGLPFTALQDAVLSHPTMVEGFNSLFANLKSPA